MCGYGCCFFVRREGWIGGLVRVRLRAHRSRPVIGRGGWSFADWRAGRANVLGSRPVQSRREEKKQAWSPCPGRSILVQYNILHYLSPWTWQTRRDPAQPGMQGEPVVMALRLQCRRASGRGVMAALWGMTENIFRVGWGSLDLRAHRLAAG